MAGGVFAPAGKSRPEGYAGGVTWQVLIVCISAASGGLLFGWDNGVTGGVESMHPFLVKFFPAVANHDDSDANPYCKFNDQGLQWFTSSLFLAATFTGLVASEVTKRIGRKLCMLVAGLFFLAGAALDAAAQNLAMLVIGRVCLGIGVGFANTSVPLYLSEMAPAQMRGALNIMFQLAVTIGIVAAQLVNYGTQHLEWGWRLSLGLAAVPATMLTLGGIFLPDTPNSLVQRGRIDEGRRVLERVRGVPNVDVEFSDIVQAVAVAKEVRNPLANIFKRKYRPELTTAIMIPFFQQFTGINAIMFYVPVLFASLGSGGDEALLNAVIIGAVNVGATFVSILLCDRLGRKWLFFEGGIQMFLAQVTTGIVLAVAFGASSDGQLDNATAVGVLVVVCVFVAAFAWSWGPLGWLVPSEIQPLETRTAGQGITVFTNFLFTFIIAQCFLSMLCAMQWGIFLFFAGWVLIMTLYTSFLLPETKGVAIEDMKYLWQSHWFWKRYAPSSTPLPAHKRSLTSKVSSNWADGVNMAHNPVAEPMQPVKPVKGVELTGAKP